MTIVDDDQYLQEDLDADLDSGFEAESLWVLLPDQDWTALQNQLSELGCHLLNQYSQDNEKFSAWNLPNDKGELDCHYDCISGLSYLVSRHADHTIQTLFQKHLPLSTTESTALLLEDNDARKRCQGIQLAKLLEADNLSLQIHQLCKDSDPKVAYEASLYCQEILGIEVLGREELGQAAESTADAVTIFKNAVNPHNRRQIIKWLLQDHKQTNTNIEKVIEYALSDVDWEVRVSAIIATARYTLVRLAALVQNCSLELGPGQQIDKRSKEIIHGIKQVALLALSKTPVEKPAGKASERMMIKYNRWWRLSQAVLGQNDNSLDLIQVSVNYFTTPHPPITDTPPASPNIISQDRFWIIKGSNIELCWVPAVPHVLGDDEQFPIQKQRPSNGFYISRLPLLNSEGEPLLMTAQQAQQYCHKLSEKLGLKISLPIQQQWQMAMRGVDGRQYPWGWGFESDWMLQASPWGLLQCWSENGELCFNDNKTMVVGKIGQPCADGELIDTDSNKTQESPKVHLRIIVDLDNS